MWLTTACVIIIILFRELCSDCISIWYIFIPMVIYAIISFLKAVKEWTEILNNEQDEIYYKSLKNGNTKES